MQLRNKRVTVVGIGESGRAACLLLIEKGAKVYATDSASTEQVKNTAVELKKRGVCVEAGAHSDILIKSSEMVVASPGVSNKSDAIRAARRMSIPIISEIELAFRFCKAPIVAVTGTNGKSTIVTLIGLMLEASGKDVVVCGNIGSAFSSYASGMRADCVVVLEASSFQLSRIRRFKPKVSVISNITQNHLDWHADFNEYFDSKKNICRNQDEKDYTVLNFDDQNLRSLKGGLASHVYFSGTNDKRCGGYLDDGRFMLDMRGEKVDVGSVDEAPLKGAHNRLNILAASVSAYLAGANSDGIRRAVREFKGLKHRFQFAGRIGRAVFIDDSKATTVDACKAALASCNEKVVLIAGGRDKGSDFTDIRGMVSEQAKAMVLIGEARGKIKRAMKGLVKIYEAEDMDEAVSVSYNIADGNGIILLSPMCASFDMYRDYKHRGDCFQKAVRNYNGNLLGGKEANMVNRA